MRPNLDDRAGPALAAAKIGVWAWSSTTGRIEWDDITGELFERGAVAADGPLDTWADAIHEADRQGAVEAVLHAVEHHHHFDLEHRLLLADGGVRWLRLAGQVEVKDGEVVGVIGVAEDVTDRATARERERTQRERLEILAALNAALDEAEDLDDLLRRVAGVLVPRLGVDVHLALTGSLADGKAPVLVSHDHRPGEPGRLDPPPALGRTALDAIRAGRAIVTDPDPEHPDGLLVIPLRKQGRTLGFVALHPGPDRPGYDADDLSLAEALSARIAASVENRRLRSERDRVARVDGRLADFGTKLAAAPDVDDVLAVIARHAAAVVEADRVDVAVMADADHLRIVNRGAALADGGPLLDLGVDDPISEAARTGDIVYDHGRGPAAFGACAASPLYDDDRQTIGVLAFRWDGAQRFDAVNATSLRTVSRLCGQALRRALFAHQTLELAELAGALASARTASDVAGVLEDLGLRAFGASSVRLELLADEAAGRGLDLAPVDPGRPGPSAGPLVRRSVVLGLPASTGSVLGRIIVTWHSAVRLDGPLRARLQTMAGVAAQTLERTLLAESEHAVVAALQKRLLPPLPDVPGYRIRAFYEPATASIGMGGDWYEVIPLDDGSLIAVIGDVVGHGVDAVADMAQIQNLITGLVATGTAVPDLLARTNAMLSATHPIYATALLLHVDGPRRRLAYQSAGHPWALVRLPDGTVQTLEDRHHAMLGTQLTSAGTTTVDLPRGATIVAYTDGLIERRNEAITDGIARLARHVEHSIDRPVGDLVAAVRADGGSELGTNDDVALLVITTEP